MRVLAVNCSSCAEGNERVYFASRECRSEIPSPYPDPIGLEDSYSLMDPIGSVPRTPVIQSARKIGTEPTQWYRGVEDFHGLTNLGPSPILPILRIHIIVWGCGYTLECLAYFSAEEYGNEAIVLDEAGLT